MSALLARTPAAPGRSSRAAFAPSRQWILAAVLGSLLRGACAGAEGWQPAASRPLGSGTISRAMAVSLRQENRTARGPGAGAARERAAEAEAGGGGPALDDTAGAAPAVEAQWQADFSLGVELSLQAMESQDLDTGRWAYDLGGSGAGVPERILRAEQLLAAGVAAAPEEQRRDRTAERALRLYHHAKWLAERDHARAAEWRFREASELARRCRRGVLAAHSLGRLGYFLRHWRRDGDAREALRESERLSTKANPLAPFLFGVLDRQVAGADLSRLHAAEERILNAQEQPSEELESERRRLVAEIEYWRTAEAGPPECLRTSEAVHALICLGAHAFGAAVRAWRGAA